MPRYKITIEYEGTCFHGWQRQKNAISVQQIIEEAFFSYGGETIKLFGSGRTDSGVHAAGQVAHFDTQKFYDEERIPLALNAHLKSHAITIIEAQSVSDKFDARRDAIERHYDYTILNRRSPPALYRALVWHIALPLNHAAMARAGSYLVGHHDFSSFRSAECQAVSPHRTLSQLSVMKDGDHIVIHASSRSFLYRQVRIITGTLVEIGLNKRNAEDILTILSQKNREKAGQTAPPQGLCLTRIMY